MKSSITRGARLGAIGVASALAFGGVAVTSAAAEEGAVAPTEGAAFDELASQFFEDDTVKAVLYDESGNIIVQQLASETEATAKPFSVSASTDAAELADTFRNVTIVPVTEDQLPEALASTDVVGGAGIGLFAPNSDQGATCSIGFTGYTPSGDPAIITAGHCTDLDGTTLSDVYLTTPADDDAAGGTQPSLLAELGTLAFGQFGGAGNSAGDVNDALDIAVVDVTNTELDLLPGVTDWTTPEDLSASLATRVTSVGTAEIGDPILRSGRTTGVSTGEATETQYGVEAGAIVYGGYVSIEGHLVKGFATTNTVDHGDSGGTVISGEKAVGVVTGSVTITESGGGVVEEFMWAHDLQTGLAATDGYSVKLFVAPAEVTSQENGANIAWNGEISGTGQAGQELEYAFVPQGGEVDFSQSATAPIDGEGNWTIQGPATPGDYTIWFRVNGEGYNVSEVSSFDVQVFPTAPEIVSPKAGESFSEPVTAITGVAAPNTEVTLSGDVTGAVKSDADGNWSYEVELAEPKSYTVAAQQTVNGKTSDKVEITFAVGAPKPAAPAFINPVDGASYTEGEAITSITGSGIDGASVELFVNGESAGTATVEAGVWTIQLDGQLPVGTHQLTARQTVDGVASDDASVAISVAAAPVAPEQPEQPAESPSATPSPTPTTPGAPEQPADPGDDSLAPTGADFGGMAPIALGFGFVLLAGGVVVLARVRQVRSQR
ncbi:hypothetical protein [Microbacterium sp. NPDC055683]